MPARDIVRKFSLSIEELDRQTDAIVANAPQDDLLQRLQGSIKEFKPDQIVPAKVLSIRKDEVIVDYGGKCEGTISRSEFPDEMVLEPGQQIEVLFEGHDDYSDSVTVSWRRAVRRKAWDEIVTRYKEGDRVKGAVQRKIKGGLLVEVDKVAVFLPASQVNIRRTNDVSEYIGKEVEAEIIKIDPERQNIVVSRRKLLEKDRAIKKESLLRELEEGQVRKGVVKNIADFGAFIDLGGIDGLLHITDMSWGRINHPSEMLKLEDEIEVKVLRVDRERERIALGLKQRTPSPWENIDQKYPVGSRHRGKVVNIVTYGAFVKLEDGVEGLVHISEMSWTRRVTNPNDLVKIGDEVDVVVLDINREKQEISLGMKQAEANPWDTVDQRYPVGTVIEGRVRNLTTYGAFIEIEEGIDGLLHISDMSWTKKVSHPAEMVKKGDVVRCVILSVDAEKKRIALGLKQLVPDPWQDTIPANYHVGDLVSGIITKMTNFGAFVQLEDDLEGLIHITELADHRISSPEEVVKLGLKVEARVIKVDTEDRKLGLSFVHADFEENEEPRRAEREREIKKREKEVRGEVEEQVRAEREAQEREKSDRAERDKAQTRAAREAAKAAELATEPANAGGAGAAKPE
ncbi:MAG: 30S ribosomal protein S1 [Planctomycetes bacterium]|nr:30S ribosomal protein S1 [Planctomycetota bacterium]